MHRANKDAVRARKLPQLVASQSAALGLFSAGLVYGWISSAGKNGANLRYDFPIDEDEFSWVSSVFDFGGAVMCIPSGVLANLVGRRGLMMAFVVPYIVGWCCVIWPNSATMLIIGRLILGGSAGPMFVTVPMYTSEIADKETRGKLSSFASLHFYAGIVVAYVMGLLHDMHLQSLISAAVPLVFFVLMSWMPESPTYHLAKGRVDEAREVLVWLRGTDYDVESELEEKRIGVAEARRSEGSTLAALRVPSVRKSLAIGYGLTFFRCAGGTDGILAYVSSIFADASNIFSDANDDNDDEYLSAIVIGVVQLLALFLFSSVIDRWGRRKLLLSSGSLMVLSALPVGTYFYLREHGTSVDHLSWIPLVGISCYLVAFSFGFAATPWIIAEIFAPEVKAAALSGANTAAWFVIFVMLKFFDQCRDSMGLYGIFWTHAAFLFLGVVFVYFIVPETKNKSLEQIQMELKGHIIVRSDVKSKKISTKTREKITTTKRLGSIVFDISSAETLKLENGTRISNGDRDYSQYF